jgi:hypothetical protein
VQGLAANAPRCKQPRVQGLSFLKRKGKPFGGDHATVREVPESAALSGSLLKAPGSAGGYLPNSGQAAPSQRGNVRA